MVIENCDICPRKCGAKRVDYGGDFCKSGADM